MANITPVSTPTPQFKPKTFWEKPEGVTGLIFMAGILLGGGYLLYKALPAIIFTDSKHFVPVFIARCFGCGHLYGTRPAYA